jgi:hypothetical protein
VVWPLGVAKSSKKNLGFVHGVAEPPPRAKPSKMFLRFAHGVEMVWPPQTGQGGLLSHPLLFCFVFFFLFLFFLFFNLFLFLFLNKIINKIRKY